MIKAIEQESLADVVEQRLYQYLKKKQLDPGDELPNEEELAKQFSISRPVVREALSRLRMMGFINSRKRRGMVVGEPKIFETLSKLIDPEFMDADQQYDFYIFRLVIELGMANLVIQNVTPELIKKMERCVQKEEAHPEDFKVFLKCDYEFHSLLYEATKNRVIKSIQPLLHRFFCNTETRKNIAPKDYSHRFENLNRTTHRGILEAIKQHDPEKFHDAMHKHLQFYFISEKTKV